MVLISYDFIFFYRGCALFIQCHYIQQWPATIAQPFPFMPEKRRKSKCHILSLLMSDHGQTTTFQIIFNINDPLSNTQ